MLGKKNNRVTAPGLSQMKRDGQKIAVLTAYDCPTAAMLDEAGIDVILVGDSVGDNVLGFENTLPVTMDDMAHHTKAVARGVHRALIVTDLPFLTYQQSKLVAVENAGRLLKEAGSHAVKLEGGVHVAGTVAELVACGIPVMGHIGMRPQSVHLTGGYRKQGKTSDDQERLLADALSIQDAGAFAVVLELVDAEASKRITEALQIPTIGIGSGPHCDGQVLVLHDMLGISEYIPKHAKDYGGLRAKMSGAFADYVADVKASRFP